MKVNVSVSSASRRDQRLDDEPAAVYLLTAGDIARSGVRTLPDALRR